MPIYKKILGQKLNRLTVCEEYYDSDKKRWMVFCICECGNTVDVRRSSFESGSTKSCGCLQKEKVMEAITKHGNARVGSVTSEYRTWDCIIQRCHNSNNPEFECYGGRGIGVCERWEKFENFLEDMGKKPGLKYTIDRIDNDGDYCKENCKWATRKEQSRNKRNNNWLECDGKTMVKADWLKELGTNNVFVDRRLKKNIPFPEIVRQAREYKAVRHWGEDIRQDDFENGYGEII